MADEYKLLREQDRGARAQSLIDNEMLTEAFSELENAYVAAWRATMLEDVAAREKLFLAINVVGKVRQHLQTILANGKLATADLRSLAETAERHRPLGVR